MGQQRSHLGVWKSSSLELAEAGAVTAERLALRCPVSVDLVEWDTGRAAGRGAGLGGLGCLSVFHAESSLRGLFLSDVIYCDPFIKHRLLTISYHLQNKIQTSSKTFKSFPVWPKIHIPALSLTDTPGENLCGWLPRTVYFHSSASLLRVL